MWTLETAKQTGRTAFGDLVGYLKEHLGDPGDAGREDRPALPATSRIWVTVDELDVEIHFPKEGVVLSRGVAVLGEKKFMHGIKVLMAKNYIDNLSEEARKGMQEKAEQGSGTTKSLLGYRNVAAPDGKKIRRRCDS